MTFASEFYKYFIKGKSVGIALKNAKRLMYKLSNGMDIAWTSFMMYRNPKLKLDI
ncbi:MAG: hypothetical protein ACTSRP_26330 [Candidatus Helarchaeota archaeon]